MENIEYGQYIYSFYEIFFALKLHKSGNLIVRSNGWRSSKNYYYYIKKPYGQISFCVYDTKTDMCITESNVNLHTDLLKHKYALYPSLEDMIQSVTKELKGNGLIE